MISSEGFIVVFQLAKNLAFDLHIFAMNLIVRLPIYIRVRSFIKLGYGLVAGVNI
jgi:hypothetical protein